MRILLAVFLVPLVIAGVVVAWLLADVPGLVGAAVVLALLAWAMSRAARPRRTAPQHPPSAA